MPTSLTAHTEALPSGNCPLSRRAFLAWAGGALSALSLGLVGCGSSQETGPGSSQAAGAAEGGAITVTDCVGRQVAIPANPARVSGLDSFTGELMVMIGAGPQLVGVPMGVASDELLLELYPQLKEVPAPMSNGAVNMEELMASNPDVVLVKRETYEAEGQAQQLDASGVPYVVVGYVSMEEQIAMMRLVGQVCGGQAQERAENLAGLYEDTIAECARRTEGLAAGERVRVYHAINALTMTDGATSVGADWIAAAGCIDVSAEHPELATTTDYTTTLEQIFEWDPDAFICNSADTADYLLTKDSCAGLRAVQAGAVHTIPVGATRWGQRGSVETWLAMLWLGATAYPQLYADFSLQDYVTAYYRDYMGIEVDDELYQTMLSGRGLRKASTDSASQK
ncbi:MAG: ABC transporter substrate-binding protein [Coriobacteriales bacterium]